MALSVYSFLGDFVVILHGVVVFVMFSYGFIPRSITNKYPRWYINMSTFFGIISILGAILLQTCPMTYAEKCFRNLAGEEAYTGSFIVHYIGSIFNFKINYLIAFVIDHLVGFFLAVVVLKLYLIIKSKKITS
jgi:hypothetical protein